MSNLQSPTSNQFDNSTPEERGARCAPPLLTALVKLNCLKFPDFCDASVGLSGPTVQSVIDDAGQLLDDVANNLVTGEDAIKALAQPLASQLDAINNNESTPVLFIVSPTPGPYTFP